MSAATVVFSATGTIQTHLVSTAGTYVIEAAGGQGGAGAGPGGRGARVSGMFYLKRSELLKIVAGTQGTAGMPPHQPCGGGGGSSMVWMGSSDLPQPIKLMLSARGGKGGKAAGVAGEAAASGGDDDHRPAADSGGLISSGGELDQLTVDTLATQWTSDTGSATPGSPRGKGRVDRGGYNAGAFPTSAPEFQTGDGYVSITPVSVPASSSSTDGRPTGGPSPAANDAKQLAPAGEPAGAGGGGSESTSSPPAVRGDKGSEAPSQTILPEVTPRLKSWENLLHRRRRP